ncbi:MAG: 3D domain-containing protein [Patescibacteria group bacterium]
MIIVFTGFVLVSTLGSFSSLEIKTKSVAVPLPKIDRGTAEKKILITATAYGPPLFPENSLTKTGEPVGWGVVAVDPKVIPLGATLSFPEIFPGKKFRALDTGKKVKGAKVDIWLPTEEAANEFGRQKITAVIINAKFP